jgi:hypothetical protein
MKDKCPIIYCIPMAVTLTLAFKPARLVSGQQGKRTTDVRRSEKLETDQKLKNDNLQNLGVQSGTKSNMMCFLFPW